MKELIRMEKVSLSEQLEEYCLTVYEGDIMYIQSFSEKSLAALLLLLTGERKPDNGKLYLFEKEVSDFNTKQAKKAGIYVVTFGKEFIDDMSIAENLKRIRPFYHFYSERKNKEDIREYLKKEGLDMNPSRLVWTLSEVERWKLGILRAKLFNARLVILDLSSIQIQGNSSVEIRNMIKKMQKEGMTFLILSSRYSTVSEAATRIQYLQMRRDIKEWECLNKEQRRKMRDGTLFFNRGKVTTQQKEKRFIGLYDYEWDISEGIWNYLYRMQKESPVLWNRYIQADLLKEGEVSNGRTVIIPRNSSDLLLEKLDIGKNLTITAGERIAHGKYGWINKRLEKRLLDDFYKRLHLQDNQKKIQDLNKLQKKILSVARWEIIKPEIIILEMPYIEMNSEEVKAFRQYLMDISLRGIRIIYMSKSINNMYEDCSVILNSLEGKSVKIDTIYHFFPPLEK